MRYLRREARIVDAMDGHYSALTEAALDEAIDQVRVPFARRRYNQQELRTALAVVREVAYRQSGEKPYVVQLMGALSLFHGQIVEMMTGEGKTLTAAVAATLLGWLRQPVHVVTVNDYLAARDASANGVIFGRCGLDAGAVVNETPQPQRVEIYMKPVVYTTQKELVADWLRDELRLGRASDPVSAHWLSSGPEQLSDKQANAVMVPGLAAVIVDEVDAVLIDEAVTPLIIAQPRGEDPQAQLYVQARKMAEQLSKGRDYQIERAERHVRLTGEGQEKIASMASPGGHAIWEASRRRRELIEQALVAEHCYHEGRQYKVVEDQVMIVDEYTGRYMPDRQWQHGLHQAVEAKHGLEVTADRDTLASLSFQRFFRQYDHLCGMTGTAADARVELETTYGLAVRIIPTNRPVRRRQLPQLICATTAAKWDAVVEQVQALHRQDRPVLIGTRSIEASELVSGLLNEHGLAHQVLNAVHHDAEAAIVAQAGQAGSITVATNMAGRGTDIKLGPGVAERGGLAVILTERHSARRIDRQLFGRAGRQGDPGSAQCILSIEDDLLLAWAPKLAGLFRRMPVPASGQGRSWMGGAFHWAQIRAQRQAHKARSRVVRHEDELDRALPRQNSG